MDPLDPVDPVDSVDPLDPVPNSKTLGSEFQNLLFRFVFTVLRRPKALGLRPKALGLRP